METQSTFTPTFVQRKIDHLKLALQERHQAIGLSELESVHLVHDSLPELDFSEISIDVSHEKLKSPFFISGMTSGHPQAASINQILAEAALEKQWIFGFGSQRRQIVKNELDEFDQTFKDHYSGLPVIGNLGVAQLITQRNHLNHVISDFKKLGCKMVAIHLNPLQEALQPEGTPQFKGALEVLKCFIEMSDLPVVIKETGSGISRVTLEKISKLKPYAVDVSGLGGTHWGRIEASRTQQQVPFTGEPFATWGVSTVQSVLSAVEVFEHTRTEVWASGGVRNGLDAAKLFALGAQRVGFGKPLLDIVLNADGNIAGDTKMIKEQVIQWMACIEKELKIALFCTGSKNLQALKGKIL